MYTLAEAAKIAKCSPRTLMRLWRKGRLAATPLGTGKRPNLRITAEALAGVKLPEPAITPPLHHVRRRRRSSSGGGSARQLLSAF